MGYLQTCTSGGWPWQSRILSTWGEEDWWGLSAVLEILESEGVHPATLALALPLGEDRERVLSHCDLPGPARRALSTLRLQEEGCLVVTYDNLDDLEALVPLVATGLELALVRLTLRGWEGPRLPDGLCAMAAAEVRLEDCPNLMELPIAPSSAQGVGELDLSIVRSGCWEQLPGLQGRGVRRLNLEDCASIKSLPRHLCTRHLRVKGCPDLRLQALYGLDTLELEDHPVGPALPKVSPTMDALRLKGLPGLSRLVEVQVGELLLEDLPALEEAWEAHFSKWCTVRGCPRVESLPRAASERAKGLWMGDGGALQKLRAEPSGWVLRGVEGTPMVEEPPRADSGPPSLPVPWEPAELEGEDALMDVLALNPMEKLNWFRASKRPLREMLSAHLKAAPSPAWAVGCARLWAEGCGGSALLGDLLEELGIHRASLLDPEANPGTTTVPEGRGLWVEPPPAQVNTIWDLGGIPLQSRWDLALVGPFTALPPWIRVVGDAEMREGDLILRDNPLLEALPEWMEVPGDLILENLPRLRAWGRHLRVGGRIRMRNVPCLPPTPHPLAGTEAHPEG